MPRTIWNGVVSFGLVNIGVKLYNAVSRKSVHFNQLDARTKSRIKQKRVSSADGSEVPNDQLVRGYEISKGEYVLVTDEELAALDPAAQRTIEIEEFVDLDSIDPIFYDSSYYLAPAPNMAKPYKLLVEAMTQTNKVGIAHFVMRQKQYVAAVRPVDGHLVLSTMIYADEINDPAELPEFEDLEDVEVPEKELTIAEQIVESLAASFEPEKHRDTYREQVLALIDRKAAGEETVVTGEGEAEPAATNVVDLMAVLEQSLADMETARERHPTAHDLEDDDAEDVDAEDAEPEEAEEPEEPAATKKPAKKKATKKRAAKKSTKKAAKKSGSTKTAKKASKARRSA